MPPFLHFHVPSFHLDENEGDLSREADVVPAKRRGCIVTILTAHVVIVTSGTACREGTAQLPWFRRCSLCGTQRALL